MEECMQMRYWVKEEINIKNKKFEDKKSNIQF